MLRFIYAPFVWMTFFFLRLVFILLGWVMVPIAAMLGAYHMTDPNIDKPADGPIYHFKWWIMGPWDNFEDGIANRNYKKFDSMFMRIVYWSCLRNPTGGLRTMPYYTCKIDPKRIGYDTDLLRVSESKDKFPHFFFCWQGFYTCFFWQFITPWGNLRRLWIGHKIIPRDSEGIKETDYRFRGAAFTTQFKKIHVKK